MLFLLLALCGTSVAILDLSSTEDPEKLTLKRSQELQARSQNSKDGLISFTSDDFKKYADFKGRKYGLVAIFTLKSGCRPCKIVGGQFSIVSSEFRKQFSSNTDLFFISLDFHAAKEVFDKFSVDQRPAISFFPPQKKYDEIKMISHDFQRGNEWTAFGIGLFVWDHTKYEIQSLPKPSFSDVDSDGDYSNAALLLLVVLFIGVFLVVSDVSSVVKRVKSFFSSFKVQFVFCALIWWLMVGGTPYNMINHPPSMIRTRDQKDVTFFHPSSHAQLGLEGYLMSGNLMITAVLLLIVNEVVPRLDDPKKLKLSVFGLLSVLYLFYKLRTVYRYKSPGYPF